MSKRTLILIVGLTALTAFFVYLALSQSRTALAPTNPAIKKVVPVQTTLMLSPRTIALSSTSGSLDVIIDTGIGDKNKVTAVQLEISYDPKKISAVSITSGTFFSNAVPLINTADPLKGTITYALAQPPTGSGKSGKGVVAHITFASLLTAGMSTEISLLPTTLVTAEGITQSVLSKAGSAMIGISVPSVSISPAMKATTSSGY